MVSWRSILVVAVLSVVYADIQNKRKELQDLVSSNLNVTIESFSDVTKTFLTDPVLVVRPRSLQHVQEVVRGCKRLALRVRASGSSHSWAPIFPDVEQAVLLTKEIKRHDGPQIELSWDHTVYPPQRVASLMTGVTVEEFRAFQLENNIEFPCNIVILQPTMGGVIATSSHGTGQTCSASSDSVVKMRIVDSDGNLQTYSDHKDGRDMMRAIKTNLGLFGIIYDITVKVSPITRAEVQNLYLKTRDVFNQKAIGNMIRSNEGVQIHWIPFTGLQTKADGSTDFSEYDPYEDTSWVKFFNRLGSKRHTTAPMNETTSSETLTNETTITNAFVVANPEATPRFTKQFLRNLRKDNKPKFFDVIPKIIHGVPAPVPPAPIYDFSWAIDVGRSYRNVVPAVDAVFRVTKNYALQGKFPLKFFMILRVVRANDMYLSPTRWYPGTTSFKIFLEVITPAGASLTEWEDYTKEISDTWRRFPGAVPHWAKQWGYVEDIDLQLRQNYNIQGFLHQLQRSGADPKGIFLNKRLEKIFYPKGHQGWKELKTSRSEAGFLDGLMFMAPYLLRKM